MSQTPSHPANAAQSACYADERERAREIAQRQKRRILLRIMCCQRPRSWKFRRRKVADRHASAKPRQQSSRRPSSAPATSLSQRRSVRADPCTQSPVYHRHTLHVPGKTSRGRKAYNIFVLVVLLSITTADSPVSLRVHTSLLRNIDATQEQYMIYQHVSWLSFADPCLRLTHEMSDEQQPAGAVTGSHQESKPTTLKPNEEPEEHPQRALPAQHCNQRRGRPRGLVPQRHLWQPLVVPTRGRPCGLRLGQVSVNR